MPVYHDDPRQQESLARRYGWSLLLYATFAGLIMGLFFMVG
ncbi:MAG: hypothetical protein ABI867_09485 [Kofleriaceae bacterium]